LNILTKTTKVGVRSLNTITKNTYYDERKRGEGNKIPLKTGFYALFPTKKKKNSSKN
jgi:hypothetical protein